MARNFRRDTFSGGRIVVMVVANKTYKIYRIKYGKKYSRYQTHFGRSLYVRVVHHYCGTRTEIPMIPLLILCLITHVRKSEDILAT